MPKVSIIGAGSSVFATQLMKDILLTPELSHGVFALVDIDAERLELAHQMAEYLIARTGRRWEVEASTDRRKVLADSDYIINTIEVAGLQTVRYDYEIPLKYGVDQVIGDTVGPGGLFKMLRTLPAWLDILEDIEMLSPRAMVLNYTNPMPSMVLAGVRASLLPIIGLCHSIQHTSHQLADYLEMPYENLDWEAAGTNHLNWFVKLEHKGEDLYPRLRERARLTDVYDQDPTRFETMLHFGAFPSESSGHHSEYLPYYRKRPDLVNRFDRGGYRGESGFYAHNWPDWRAAGDEHIRDVLAGTVEYELKRSDEYASYIMEALAEGRPALIYGNVLNNGFIDNLPNNGVVEVACRVDEMGLNPQHFGALPPQLAALNRQHMAFHELTVIAVLEHRREAALQALMLDPLTAAVCSLSEIRQMFDEMVAAQREYLPEYLYL
jgi:alpha-galactosidase